MKAAVEFLVGCKCSLAMISCALNYQNLHVPLEVILASLNIWKALDTGSLILFVRYKFLKKEAIYLEKEES